MKLKYLFLLAFASLVIEGCNRVDDHSEESSTTWQLGPFVKADEHNPVLLPLDSTQFLCPVRQELVRWEVKDVFNPSAVIRNDTIFLIYRAEDSVGIYSGTSRIGLAFSIDGMNFTRYPEPVFYPDNDFMKKYEWEGGVEDPRVIKAPDGRYVLTYTSYEGKTPRLCVASSDDLVHWSKHGLAFAESEDDKYADLWSKSGSIVSTYTSGSPEAKKINEAYWMFWGDTDIFLAKSTDLIHWEPIEDQEGNLLAVLSPRDQMFDSRLVEPGPPAMYTENGIVLIYNGMNLDGEGRDTTLPRGTYSAGQALFSSTDPMNLIDRSQEYFITPDKDYEIVGQIGNVCFLEGLVRLKNTWFVYYGTADSKIAVATYQTM